MFLHFIHNFSIEILQVSSSYPKEGSRQGRTQPGFASWIWTTRKAAGEHIEVYFHLSSIKNISVCIFIVFLILSMLFANSCTVCLDSLLLLLLFVLFTNCVYISRKQSRRKKRFRARNPGSRLVASKDVLKQAQCTCLLLSTSINIDQMFGNVYLNSYRKHRF